MPDQPEILIAGGYGEVGRRIARTLGPRNPGQLVVAGRHPERAGGLPAIRLDISDPSSLESALDGIRVVIGCLREPDAQLLRAAVRRGIAYTSIAPPWLERHELEALNTEARSTGARVVLATGLEPGISSVLARIGADRVGQADAVETALLLSVGDAYGPDSMGFIFEEIRKIYTVRIEGRDEPMQAFARPKRVDFPAPIGPRWAYAMPFTDQRYYPDTLGARTSIARIALDPPWVASVIAALLRLGLRARLGQGRARQTVHGLVQRLRALRRGHDQFALVVEVRGGGRVVRSTLIGRQQAEATAIGAQATAEALALGEVIKPGVWLAEQVLTPEPFLERLAARGLVPITEEREAQPRPGGSRCTALSILTLPASSAQSSRTSSPAACSSACQSERTNRA